MTNIGNEILDAAKYVGKNFWKVLPVGSLINYGQKVRAGKSEGNRNAVALHFVYALIGTGALITYSLDKFSPDKKEISPKSKTEEISYDDSAWNAYTGFGPNSTKLDTAKFLSDNCLEGKIHFDEITKKEKQNEIEDGRKIIRKRRALIAEQITPLGKG